jgi:hypothetical protein
MTSGVETRERGSFCLFFSSTAFHLILLVRRRSPLSFKVNWHDS